MSYEDYQKAQKLGVKAHKSCVAHGEYPYLPALDEILSHVETEYEEHLGISEIPLHHVTGTGTRERTRGFASNFMPLLDQGSEFATKWMHLIEAQMTEGIRDPVKVYEYMNKYYVVEGNKRVSVLKYVDCPTVLADVTRIVPKRSDDMKTRIYYEYMDFHAVSQIDYVHFSKPGRYDQLLEAIGKASHEIWSQEERRDFAGFYLAFEKMFFEKEGDELKGVTAGDAMLFYLTLYPYEQSKIAPPSQIKKNLEKMWPEITMLGKDEAVELSMEPSSKKRTVSTVLSRVKSAKKRRAAFVYNKTPEESGWIDAHEKGRIKLQEKFGESLETAAFTVKAEQDQDELMQHICMEGYDIIFAVTPELIRACLKAAASYPNVIILNCALNSSYNTIRTYHARMYEAKFLSGIIAGTMTDNDKVGYVADYPLYGAAADINAFSMGVRMVNPHAKVYLAWSTVKNFDVDKYFEKEKIKIVSGHDMITSKAGRNSGLYQITETGKINLALPSCSWSGFYERLIKSIMRGYYRAEGSSEDKAINYWWGISAGAVDIICSEHVPDGVLKLVEAMKKSISSDLFQPLTGPLTDQSGRLHYREHEEMKPEDIMRMDWLMDNVTGSIPTVDELKEEARRVVMLKGLYAVTADKGGNVLL